MINLCCESFIYFKNTFHFKKWMDEISENIYPIPFNFSSPGYWQIVINNHKYYCRLDLIKYTSYINYTFYMLVLNISTTLNIDIAPSKNEYKFNIKAFELNEDSIKRQVFEENHILDNLVSENEIAKLPLPISIKLYSQNLKIIELLFYSITTKKQDYKIDLDNNNNISKNKNLLTYNNQKDTFLNTYKNKYKFIEDCQLAEACLLAEACQLAEDLQLAEPSSPPAQPGPKLDSCPFCLKVLDPKALKVLNPCGHSFCARCCDRLFMTSPVRCPCCRKITTSSIKVYGLTT